MEGSERAQMGSEAVILPVGTQTLFAADECGEGRGPSSRAREDDQALRDLCGARLLRARHAAGFKQLDVAITLGHSNLTMISLYECGRRAAPLKDLCTLADLYNVSADYLLGRTDDIGMAPEEGNQALIMGVVKGVLMKQAEQYLTGLAKVTAISVESASTDRVILGRLTDISIELSSALGVIRKHHSGVFETLRGGGKLERLVSEMSVTLASRIGSKQREKALIDYEHPTFNAQQVVMAVQTALFAE
ncbi:helix-turn-helix domain-containing protein [Pseudomonas viridiflava]|uniref:helix-turn-helix domain-containing protein n=1 Tax=Pseudomonas viridiflava TaxID=33069 RepID=UPI0013CE7C80|nr:helix-turn-helix transcriptional regulator [Pseudomonas viridiflava]